MTERDSIVGELEKRWRIEPRTRIPVERAAWQSLQCRDVRVPEHDQVEIRVERFDRRGGATKSPTAVARRVSSARVRAVICERSRKVWMKPTERANRHGISQNMTNETVAFVFARSEPIAMLDVRAPSVDLVSPGPKQIVHADVPAKNIAAPAVMIAGDHDHGHSGIDDVGERRKCTKTAARDNRAPLEPEFEQVAIDDERFGIRGDVSQKRDHRAFDLVRREAEVRVGHDVARRVEHARILPAPSALYKRLHLDELGRVTIDSSPDSAALHHDVEFRVRYAETDQMGVVYHTNYLIWCEVGRTDFIRSRGMSYADLERAGVGLAVSELTARFHAAAKYDDMVRVRTTLAEVRSRGITFDYVITRVANDDRLVSARTALVSIDASGRPVALPKAVRSLFEPT